MATRCGITIKEKGHSLDFSRHWDGYPSGIASDLKYADPKSTISIIEYLNMSRDCESGIEYQYDFDLDNGAIAAYKADWKTDERTDLLFEGTIEDFIDKYDKQHNQD